MTPEQAAFILEMRVLANALALEATETEWRIRQGHAVDERDGRALMAQARTYLGPGVREVG